MADKTAIELGLRMYRLMDHEDFLPLLAEMDERIANRKLQLKASASTLDCPPHILNNIAQRQDEISSLREWIDDAIERGGQEKMKQDVLDARVTV